MHFGFQSVVILFIYGFCCISANSLGRHMVVPDTGNFVLVKEEHGIALYERWYNVKPDQQAREIKATFRVKAEADDAAGLIKDESRGKQWNKKTAEYKVVPENENIWLAYILYDLPWPVSNQDCVLRYSRDFAGDSVVIKFKETDHPDFPVNKRVQRIPAISGKWVFNEDVSGISVEYYITTTPSSTLPSWITDPVIRSNLIETLQAFRSLLEDDE